MRLFRRAASLRSGDAPQRPDGFPERPNWMRDGMAVQLLEGAEVLEVVGESNYQAALWAIVGSAPSADKVQVSVVAVLASEPDNPYDANAIAVWVGGGKVGYLSRENALRYGPGLRALTRQDEKPVALRGIVAWGGMYADGPGRLGVFLHHDPADFGLPAALSSHTTLIDTGLTTARERDANDDSYDLGWVDQVPGDPIRAIPVLRNLLETERDPIDRHFVFHQLETSLYRSRDAFGSALDEFDDVCRQHDGEMEAIRDAFVEKWGDIPWLHTYKQMCIRLAKAKDYEQALRWAERGLAIYGDKAARPDAVDDLRKRAASYQTKLAQLPKPAG